MTARHKGTTGNDIDAPGFLQSFDPETGEVQWKFYTVPMKQGDVGLDTWASLDAARHGGARPARGTACLRNLPVDAALRPRPDRRDL